MRCYPVLAAILLSLSFPLAAQPKLGDVAFANSGAAAAQQAFLQGLALLHDFEYSPAAEAFRQAQAADPDFALAYWGEAMTYNHAVWMEQDAGAARAVLARLGPTPEARAAKAPSAREKAYLHAVETLYGEGSKEERDVRYSAEMAALHARFPDDVDATAFYALSLLGTAHNGRDYAIYMRAAALLEDVFPTHRQHPGVLHYLIHSYDDPIHAPLGLRAARLYGGIAPNAGHALHMTSHIFIAMGMWDEVIHANVEAMRTVTSSAPPMARLQLSAAIIRNGCSTLICRRARKRRLRLYSAHAAKRPNRKPRTSRLRRSNRAGPRSCHSRICRRAAVSTCPSSLPTIRRSAQRTHSCGPAFCWAMPG